MYINIYNNSTVNPPLIAREDNPTLINIRLKQYI